jgi:hypothetical protein
MVFRQGINGYTKERLNSAVVPRCFASLHAVVFVDVDGAEHELYLAKFFMQNCMMLQRMHFYKYSQSQGPDEAEALEEFSNKLYSFGSLNFVSVYFRVGRI